MKVILCSIGTRGDIEPFLAIAQLLSSKKWEVLCAFPAFGGALTPDSHKFR
jgi:UDP:flavonoid glycosyltransferase YjiC (YdhE family)